MDNDYRVAFTVTDSDKLGANDLSQLIGHALHTFRVRFGFVAVTPTKATLRRMRLAKKMGGR